MEFVYNSIGELNDYYFNLFRQTQGLIQSCDKHYFKYVQNLLVKRYKRDAKRFAKDEKKEYRIFRKSCKKTTFDKILQELTQKHALNAKQDIKQNFVSLNRPTADCQQLKANTGDQETGEQPQQFAQETRQDLESPEQEDWQPQKQKDENRPIEEEKASQDALLPL